MTHALFVWVVDPLYFLILSLLLWLQIYRLRVVEQTRGKTGAKILCSLLQLKHISYLVLSCGLISSFFHVSTRIIHIIHPFLTNSICFYINHVDITLTLLAHFAIHLFVALRSRLCVTDIASKNISIFYKTGLILITTDIGLIIYPWFTNTISCQFDKDNGICIIWHRKESLIIWTVISDVTIGIYSLIVFVIPLRKHLQWEQSTKESIVVSNNASVAGSKFPSPSAKDDMSLTKLVYKVLIYSTIMIITSIILMVIIAILNNIHTISAGSICMFYVYTFILNLSCNVDL